MNDEVASLGDGSTRGFLFADLRGYTHMVDTRGAVEASRLLGRYRDIVREVVALHGGAEIKTEGDSFYVVLPSASAALRCGLHIRKSCTEPVDGGEAIKLGIGIHAGESVAHEGGFVGSAINIAARICALATAGEVLVSGTIRELTRSIVAAEFVFVGRRHLKGLDQPVEVFSVAADGATSSGRRGSATLAGRPAWWLAVAVIVIAGVGGGAAFAVGWRPISGLLGASSSATPASSGPSSSQLAASPSVLLQKLPEVGLWVDAGTYAPIHNRDVVSVSIQKCCWKVAADVADLLFFAHSGLPGAGNDVGVGIAHITVVYTGGCDNSPTRLVGDGPKGLVDWVEHTPQLDASEPHPLIDLGLSGIGIDATVLAPPAGESCSLVHAKLWGVGTTYWQPNIGDHIRFEALDDGSRTLTIVYWGPTAAELSYAKSEGQGFIDSFVVRN